VNLFIVGEQKCGTSSLHDYLQRVPTICTASQKELRRFNGDDYLRDDAAYEARFRTRRLGPNPQYLLDSTPDYCWDDRALDRLHRYNPDAKIIFLTREPKARFVSAYRFYRFTVDPNHGALRSSEAGRRMARFMAAEPDFTFERFTEIELGDAPVFDAIARCDYSETLTRILARFPTTQVWTTSLENLSSPENSAATLQALGEFLSLPMPEEGFPRRNSSRGASVSLDPAVAAVILERLSSP